MKFVERPRKQPEFPDLEANTGLLGILEFILSIILWIVLLVVFFFTIYTNFFRKNLQSLLYYFGYKTNQVPFWIAGLCSFFLFPLTLVVIVLGYVLKK